MRWPLMPHRIVQAEWGGVVTFESIEWTEGGRERVGDVVRPVHAVQSTIQREMEVAVVKTAFTTGGHSEHTRRQHVVLPHPIRVTCDAKYNTITGSTVCTCESHCFPQINSILRLAVCESRASQALAQAHSIDTLHLTRFAIGIQWDPNGGHSRCNGKF